MHFFLNIYSNLHIVSTCIIRNKHCIKMYVLEIGIESKCEQFLGFLLHCFVFVVKLGLNIEKCSWPLDMRVAFDPIRAHLGVS